jgi:Dirigent-like protein
MTVKTLNTTAIVALIGLVAAGTVSASPRANGPLTFTFTSVQTKMTPAAPMTMKSPPQIGDRMIFNDALYNRGAEFGKPSGALIGTADNICTIVRARSLQCTLVAHVPNGALVVTGTVSANSRASEFAITGGVGAYANATGTATGHDLSQTKTLVTVQVDS